MKYRGAACCRWLCESSAPRGGCFLCPTDRQHARAIGCHAIVQHQLAKAAVIEQRRATTTARYLVAVVGLEHEVTVLLHATRIPNLFFAILGHGFAGDLGQNEAQQKGIAGVVVVVLRARGIEALQCLQIGAYVAMPSLCDGHDVMLGDIGQQVFIK